MRTILFSFVFILYSSLCSAQESQGPHFYIGVYAAASNYNIFYRNEIGSRLIANRPIMLLGGYQITPKLAAQIGFVNSHQTFTDEGSYTLPNGTATSYQSKDEQRSLAIPTLLRYTLTHNLSRRIKFDMLGGITIVRASYHNQAIRTDDDQTGQTVMRRDQKNKAFNALLTIGPAVRVSVIRHIETNISFSLNRSLHYTNNSVQNDANLWGLTPSFSGGINYIFLYK